MLFRLEVYWFQRGLLRYICIILSNVYQSVTLNNRQNTSTNQSSCSLKQCNDFTDMLLLINIHEHSFIWVYISRIWEYSDNNISSNIVQIYQNTYMQSISQKIWPMGIIHRLRKLFTKLKNIQSNSGVIFKTKHTYDWFTIDSYKDIIVPESRWL